jgi:plastocyanin
MLATALHLLPVLGAEAEKSRTAFYICGGAFAAWAVIVSVGIGLRRPNFPGTLGGQRVVIAITAVLMVSTMSTAIITSGPAKGKASASTAPAAATSSGQTSSAGTASKPLSLAADSSGQLKYNTNKLTAKAGKVTIEFMNSSPVEHNVTIADASKTLGATPTFQGGKKTLTLNLQPGTYTFYCSVPGHRQAGMEGTLTVS